MRRDTVHAGKAGTRGRSPCLAYPGLTGCAALTRPIGGRIDTHRTTGMAAAGRGRPKPACERSSRSHRPRQLRQLTHRASLPWNRPPGRRHRSASSDGRALSRRSSKARAPQEGDRRRARQGHNLDPANCRTYCDRIGVRNCRRNCRNFVQYCRKSTPKLSHSCATPTRGTYRTRGTDPRAREPITRQRQLPLARLAAVRCLGKMAPAPVREAAPHDAPDLRSPDPTARASSRRARHPRAYRDRHSLRLAVHQPTEERQHL